MNAFAALSAFARAIFALWALLLCLSCIGFAVLAAVRKRFCFTALALLLLVPEYFLWQVIFDLHLFGTTEQAASVSRTLGGLPWLIWLAAFAVLSLAAALMLRYHLRYDRSHLTPGTIKVFLDKMPCGICCWRDSGRVLFSNICMNRLCEALTGTPLLNGSRFCDAVSEGIFKAEGKVWRFSCRDITVNGENLHEMIASDITSEYARTASLEKEKAELSQLNRELEEYYLSIDDTVRRQEILQAKMNIHDEMNRLMLSTAAADREDTATLDSLFSLWEQNALLLCMESGGTAHSYRKDAVDRLADALGISLIWHGEIPPELSDSQKELFLLTAQEAIINAVKHAQAHSVAISFEQTSEGLTCRFVNDGSIPTKAISFSGGLRNLSRLAQMQGATLSAEADSVFTLTLCFSNVKNQPIG